MVFRGGPGDSRGAQAFTPISASDGALAEMQNESRKSDWTALSQAAPSALAAQPPALKPQKRALRHVAEKASNSQM